MQVWDWGASAAAGTQHPEMQHADGHALSVAAPSGCPGSGTFLVLPVKASATDPAVRTS